MPPVPRVGRDDLARLERLSLEELTSRFPDVWRQVGARLVAAAEERRPEALAALVQGALEAAATWRERVRRSHGNPEVAREAAPWIAAARMARLAVERTAVSAATGVEAGSFRLGLLDGLLVQRLLFARGLERKPVSMRAFRLLWPLVRGKRLLMPLVQPRGIYCFYSRDLVRALAALAGGRPALELGAGDGTLSRFLSAEGAAVRATDDRSWARAIRYPDHVEPLDAVAALARHPAPTVFCSFPPPGNRFERAVFRTPTVERYVVIGSRHRHAAGDWDAYEAQQGFERVLDERLSGLVLPPELDPAVLVFTRRR